jgi:protein TonB
VFEAFFNHRREEARPHVWLRLTVVGSLGLHGGLLVGAGAYAVWRVDEVPPPALAVTFAGGRALAPPPRPVERPEPARAKAKPPKTDLPRIAALVQPQAPRLPEEARLLEPAPAQPLPPDSGPAPGTAAVAAPARVLEAQPVTVPVAVGAGQRITDVGDPRFRPSLPGPLNRAGVMLWGLFEICVGTDGSVTAVKVLKTAAPEVDDEWARVIRTWRYRPYALEGRAVPFCHTMRLEVQGAS